MNSVPYAVKPPLRSNLVVWADAATMSPQTSFQEDTEADQHAVSTDVFAEHKSGAASGGRSHLEGFLCASFFYKRKCNPRLRTQCGLSLTKEAVAKNLRMSETQKTLQKQKAALCNLIAWDSCSYCCYHQIFILPKNLRLPKKFPKTPEAQYP